MSILIKGIEMPKDGNFVELLIWSDGHVTKTGDSYIAEDGRAYYQPCTFEYFQAVPVPPHGDLIDRDALLQEHERIVDSWGLAHIVSAQAVRAAPAIIPAEEGET